MIEKSTPGPWEYDDSGKHSTYNVVRNNGMVVCRILPLSYKSHGSMEANARLIVAAPDLLAASKRALDWLASYPGNGALGAYEEMRLAIVKAEGELS